MLWLMSCSELSAFLPSLLFCLTWPRALHMASCHAYPHTLRGLSWNLFDFLVSSLINFFFNFWSAQNDHLLPIHSTYLLLSFCFSFYPLFIYSSVSSFLYSIYSRLSLSLYTLNQIPFEELVLENSHEWLNFFGYEFPTILFYDGNFS